MGKNVKLIVPITQMHFILGLVKDICQHSSTTLGTCFTCLSQISIMRCDQKPSLLTCAKFNCFDLNTCLNIFFSDLTPLQLLFTFFCTHLLKRSNVRELDSKIHVTNCANKTEKMILMPRIEVNEFVALTPILSKCVTKSSHFAFISNGGIPIVD